MPESSPTLQPTGPVAAPYDNITASVSKAWGTQAHRQKGWSKSGRSVSTLYQCSVLQRPNRVHSLSNRPTSAISQPRENHHYRCIAEPPNASAHRSWTMTNSQSRGRKDRHYKCGRPYQKWQLMKTVTQILGSYPKSSTKKGHDEQREICSWMHSP